MNEVLEVARAAAQAAAVVHREHLGRVAVADWSEKGTADFVSHVDRAAEAAIVDLVLTRFPDHRVLAEEAASERGASNGVPNEGWTWIIDPLDGTTNYLHGYPSHAVSIGVTRDGELEVGVVLDTARGDEWNAVRRGGAFRNGSRIAVSQIDVLSRALIGTGFPFKSLHLLPQYASQLAAMLHNTAGVRRAGSAALDLCHVATGWFDGFWELDLAPWDIAAGVLMVREAGGVVTRLDGTRDMMAPGPVLAGNPAIHAGLDRMLRGIAAAETANASERER